MAHVGGLEAVGRNLHNANAFVAQVKQELANLPQRHFRARTRLDAKCNRGNKRRGQAQGLFAGQQVTPGHCHLLFDRGHCEAEAVTFQGAVKMDIVVVFRKFPHHIVHYLVRTIDGQGDFVLRDGIVEALAGDPLFDVIDKGHRRAVGNTRKIHQGAGEVLFKFLAVNVRNLNDVSGVVFHFLFRCAYHRLLRIRADEDRECLAAVNAFFLLDIPNGRRQHKDLWIVLHRLDMGFKE